MLKINTLTFAQLKNTEHVSLFQNVKVAIDKYTTTAIGLSADQYDAYKAAVDQEQDIVNRSMGSIYTPEMKAMDEERDRLFRRIHFQLQTVIHAASSADVAAYINTVKRHLLDKYGNDVTQAAYQEESALIGGFILDANNFLGEEGIEACGIAEDLAALEAANKAFSDMYHERVAERAGTDIGYAKNLREKTEEEFLHLACHIEFKVNNDASSIEGKYCTSLLAVINQLFAEARQHLNLRLGKTQGVTNENEGEEGTSGIEAPVFPKK